nr:LacI family DNA-binding transcriptional regulator [Hymenobacter terrenus]
MKNTPVTIKAIAATLNVSISTVSRALRDMPEVRAETRAAVQRLAAELDYQPNQLAKNLLYSRTRTIGVLMPNLSYHFYTAMLASIEEAALAAGYSLLVCQSNESHEREIINIQNLLRGQVEGFLLSVARDSTDYEHIARLTRRNFPLVLFDRYADEINASKVIIDDKGAAYRATEHLIEQGCRRIGFLAGPPNLLISNQRLLGYRAALVQYGLPLNDAYMLHCDLTPEDARTQTNRLMNLPAPPMACLWLATALPTPPCSR